MGDAVESPSTRAHDPAEVLGAVLGAVRRTGTDMLAVLRPLPGPGGDVEDFEVVADSEMLSALGGAPSVGRRLLELMPVDLAARVVTFDAEAVREGTVTRGDVVLARTGEGLVPAADDADAGPDVRVGELVRVASEGYLVLLGRDVTEQRAAERRLRQEALQDALTGLANRRWFGRALAEAVSRSSRTGAPFAVLVLDVDDFKAVNDELGHAAGDALLADLAHRLTGALRPADTAARLGGDEFVVIAEDLHSAQDAAAVARRILERCSGTYGVGGDESVRVTVSIGIATSADIPGTSGGGPGSHLAPPRDGVAGAPGADAADAGSARGSAFGRPRDPGADLLRRADDALLRAKRRGRDRIELADVAGPG